MTGSSTQEVGMRGVLLTVENRSDGITILCKEPGDCWASCGRESAGPHFSSCSLCRAPEKNRDLPAFFP